jgi:hypothetical protein
LRHQLRAAERELADLQRRHDELADEVVSAGSTGDHERLRGAGEELSRVGDRLVTAEEAWLELAQQAEERGLDV